MFCFMPEKVLPKPWGFFVERFVGHISREVFTQAFAGPKTGSFREDVLPSSWLVLPNF